MVFIGLLLQKEVFSGKKESKEPTPSDLTNHILSRFLIMGNIFLQTRKTIDSIREIAAGSQDLELVLDWVFHTSECFLTAANAKCPWLVVVRREH